LPKKILFVHHFPGMGGAPLSLLYTIEKLDRALYHPVVLFLANQGDAIDLYRRKNIEIYTAPQIGFFPHGDNGWLKVKNIPEIIRRIFDIKQSVSLSIEILKEIKPDIVHINTSFPHAFGIASKKMGIPLVWHIREPIAKGYFGIRRHFIQKNINKCADAIIAISQNDANSMGKFCERVQVVYNYVDFSYFDKNINPEQCRKEVIGKHSVKDNVVTMLGGVVHSKGADIFLKAAAEIIKTRNDVIFILAGSKPELLYSSTKWKKELRLFLEKWRILDNMSLKCLRIVNKIHDKNRILFCGMVDNVPQILGATNILVWPATMSHFSRPVIEAGAMSKVVIASDFSSSRELVTHKFNGLLIKSGRVDALVDAINHLLNNPEEAERMGENGYKIALERYNAITNTKVIFSIYENLLNAQK